MISLNLDDLCTGQNTIEREMRHWQFTRSPLVYWTQKMVKMATTDRYGFLMDMGKQARMDGQATTHIVINEFLLEFEYLK